MLTVQLDTTTVWSRVPAWQADAGGEAGTQAGMQAGR